MTNRRCGLSRMASSRRPKKAPAKRAARKPRTMVHAAKLTRKTMLETLRDKLAAAIDDPRSHPRDQINAAKQLLEIQNQIDQLAGKGRPATTAPAGPSAVANTPNEHWDEDAI